MWISTSQYTEGKNGVICGNETTSFYPQPSYRKRRMRRVKGRIKEINRRHRSIPGGLHIIVH